MMVRSVIVAAALASAACTSANDGTPPGPVGERNFPTADFHAVESAGAFDVVVQVGGAPSVRAEGPSNMLDRLEIRVDDGVLKIGNRRDGWQGWNRGGRVTVHVVAPSIDGAALAGSGDLSIDRVQAENFRGSLSGSGDLSVGTLQAGRAAFSLAGSGNVRASGTAGEADVRIAGSGDVDLGGLQTRRASVSIAGSGDIDLQASEEVTGAIMGSGDVSVTGGARCSIRKMGSGDVRCG